MVELSGSLDVFYNDQYVLQFHVFPFFISAGSTSYINLFQHVNIRQRTFAEHQQTALYESRQQKNDVPELKSEAVVRNFRTTASFTSSPSLKIFVICSLTFVFDY